MLMITPGRGRRMNVLSTRAKDAREVCRADEKPAAATTKLTPIMPLSVRAGPTRIAAARSQIEYGVVPART